MLHQSQIVIFLSFTQFASLPFTSSYAKVEKIPGGTIEESRVLNGVMFNKDVTHAKMRRYIENPRIVLLDCPLEYKKGESQTNIEILGEQVT